MPQKRKLKFKVGDNVIWVGGEGAPNYHPPVDNHGIVRYIDLNPGTTLPYFVEWTGWFKGANGEMWQESHPGLPMLPTKSGSWAGEEMLKLWKEGARPPRSPEPAPKPERPTAFQPGDRVRLLVIDSPGKDSVGTVIGTYGEPPNRHVAVDWAPWRGGHNMSGTFVQLGYSTGTQLPDRTGWNVKPDDIQVIQRGNITYEEEREGVRNYYVVIIGIKGMGEEGDDATRFEKFSVSVDAKEDDANHTWYKEWEGGGDELYLPNSKTAIIEHIESWGDVIYHTNSTWTETFEREE